MATTTAKTLAHTQPGTGAAAAYTVPSATKAIIRHIRAVNTDASTAYTLDLYRNGSAAANQLIATKTIQPSSEWEDDVYIPLETVGDTIQAKASSASKITLYLGGVEIS